MKKEEESGRHGRERKKLKRKTKKSFCVSWILKNELKPNVFPMWPDFISGKCQISYQICNSVASRNGKAETFELLHLHFKGKENMAKKRFWLKHRY